MREILSYTELKPIIQRGVSMKTFSKDEMALKSKNIKLPQPDRTEDGIGLEEFQSKKDELAFWQTASKYKASYRVYSDIVFRPPAREDPHLLVVSLAGESGGPHLALFGGMGYEQFSDLWTLPAPTKLSSAKKWDDWPIKFEAAVSETASFYQCSLTKCDRPNRALIFGGFLKTDKQDGLETQSGLLYSIDFDAKVCSKVTTQTPLNPGGRRLHTVNFVDGGLVLVGGIDPKDEPVDQVWRFKLSRDRGPVDTGSWSQFPLFVEGLTQSGFTSTLHLHASASIPSTSKSRHANKVEPADQVLLFGGFIDGAGPENKTLSLQSLPMNVRVSELVCKGQAPQARTAHRMEYLPRSTPCLPAVDCVLLVGGRSEFGDELNDLHLFFLERDTWVALRTPPHFPLRRNFGVGVG